MKKAKNGNKKALFSFGSTKYHFLIQWASLGSEGWSLVKIQM
jgi:hypothetical protein